MFDGQAYLAETNSSNVTQVEFTNEPAAYGGLVSQRRSGAIWTPSYYHFDAVGSTRGLTGTSQDWLVFYPHLAFGQQLTDTNPFENAFRFIVVL